MDGLPARHRRRPRLAGAGLPLRLLRPGRGGRAAAGSPRRVLVDGVLRIEPGQRAAAGALATGSSRCPAAGT